MTKSNLYENPDYMQMFSDELVDLIANEQRPGRSTRRSLEYIVGELRQQIQEKIDWARETLQRSDRIIWYLRFYRMAVMCGVHLQPRDSGFRAVKSDCTAAVRRYNRKTRGTPLPDDFSIWLASTPLTSAVHYNSGVPRGYRGGQAGDVVAIDFQLGHFLALDIRPINDIVFDWQTPDELLTQMAETEESWKERFTGLIPIADASDYDVLKDFGDGFVWFDTHERQVYDQCFETTGHCSTCFREDETAWVLRESVEVDGELFWRPVLQFCINEEGWLGEMKGSANAKPAERYHKYIIPLLFSDKVAGINGGGYLSETNFSINDLPEEWREKAASNKPFLFTIQESLERFGDSVDFDGRVEFLERRSWGGKEEFDESVDGDLILATYTVEDALNQFGSSGSSNDYDYATAIVDGCGEVDPGAVEDAVAALSGELAERMVGWEDNPDKDAAAHQAYREGFVEGVEKGLQEAVEDAFTSDRTSQIHVISDTDDAYINVTVFWSYGDTSGWDSEVELRTGKTDLLWDLVRSNFDFGSGRLELEEAEAPEVDLDFNPEDAFDQDIFEDVLAQELPEEDDEDY
jgi:hypothetical protein